MPAEKVRLVYSTSINYGSILYRLLVALMFSVTVARKLNVEDFAVYGVIITLTVMFSSLTVAWNYWAARWVTFGREDVLGTSLLLSLVGATVLSAVYIAVSYIITLSTGWSMWKIILGIPLMYTNILYVGLRWIAGVAKPQTTGFSQIIYETLRLTLGYIVIVELHLGLPGAVAVLSLGYLLSSTYLLSQLIALKMFSLKVSYSVMKQLLSSSLTTIYMVLSNMLRAWARGFLSIVTGNDYAVAYYNLGVSAEGPLVNSANTIGFTLYSSLLREKEGRNITTTIRLYLLFTGFMLATYVILAKPIASLFNPRYVDAWPVLVVMSVLGFTLGVRGIIQGILLGVDRSDAEPGLGTRGSVTEKTLKVVFYLTLIGYITSTPLLYTYRDDPLAAALLLGSVLTLVSIVSMIPLVRWARRCVEFNVPWREVLAFAVSTVFLAGYYHIAGARNVLVTRFYEQAPLLLVHVVIGGLVFYSTYLALSPWSRRLVLIILEKAGVLHRS